MQELDISEVFRAREVLKEVATETRIIGPTKLADYCQVYLKPENMQMTGSFKLRGAYYKISQLSEEEKARGVIACSAGNHAQGVALGATHNGIKSVICLPAGAPLSKVEATKGYGAEVCLVPGVYVEAECLHINGFVPGRLRGIQHEQCTAAVRQLCNTPNVVDVSSNVGSVRADDHARPGSCCRYRL